MDYQVWWVTLVIWHSGVYRLALGIREIVTLISSFYGPPDWEWLYLFIVPGCMPLIVATNLVSSWLDQYVIMFYMFFSSKTAQLLFTYPQFSRFSVVVLLLPKSTVLQIKLRNQCLDVHPTLLPAIPPLFINWLNSGGMLVIRYNTRWCPIVS